MSATLPRPIKLLQKSYPRSSNLPLDNHSRYTSANAKLKRVWMLLSKVFSITKLCFLNSAFIAKGMFRQTETQTQTLTKNHIKNLCPDFTMHSCTEISHGTLFICTNLCFYVSTAKNKLRYKKSFASILILLKTLGEPLGHVFLTYKMGKVLF